MQLVLYGICKIVVHDVTMRILSKSFASLPLLTESDRGYGAWSTKINTAELVPVDVLKSAQGVSAAAEAMTYRLPARHRTTRLASLRAIFVRGVRFAEVDLFSSSPSIYSIDRHVLLPLINCLMRVRVYSAHLSNRGLSANASWTTV